MEKSLKTKTEVYLERASTTYEGGQLFSLSLNSFAHDLNLGIFLGLVKLESKQQEVYKYERNKLSIIYLLSLTQNLAKMISITICTILAIQRKDFYLSGNYYSAIMYSKFHSFQHFSHKMDFFVGQTIKIKLG